MSNLDGGVDIVQFLIVVVDLRYLFICGSHSASQLALYGHE